MGYFAGGAGTGFINLYTNQTQGGMGITTSNKLVAPIAGLYHFGFQTIFNSTANQNCYLSTYLNGVWTFASMNEANTNGYHYRTLSMCYYLNANDYIQFYNDGPNTLYGTNYYDDTKWRTWYFYHVA
jgi:hypothetical protein